MVHVCEEKRGESRKGRTQGRVRRLICKYAGENGSGVQVVIRRPRVELHREQEAEKCASWLCGKTEGDLKGEMRNGKGWCGYLCGDRGAR